MSVSELKGGITVNAPIVLMISEALSLASEKYYNTRRKKHIMVLLLKGSQMQYYTKFGGIIRKIISVTFFTPELYLTYLT